MRTPRFFIRVIHHRVWMLSLGMVCFIFSYIEWDALSNDMQRDDPGRLRSLQRELQESNDDDGISLRQTILPTLILTPAPTRPTGIPSSSPSEFPTIFSEVPSAPPSKGPSEQPSTSLSPSLSPSLSWEPTLSQGPSYSPSVMPSKTPTMQPTKSPTTVPSLQPSSLPTPSPSSTPTASMSPSIDPSFIPTDFPTVSSGPSQAPSISAQPTRTREPTNLPSTSPTLFPTASPSIMPTPRPPTQRPSKTPSRLPSLSPSLSPSSIPTMFPTLNVFPVVAPSITMVLVGFPARLSAIQRGEWENMTGDHVLRFYQKFNEIDRGVIPVNVTNVTTVFLRQIYQPEDGRLEIEYAQTLVLGKFRETENDEVLFVAPFVENTQDYVIDLLTTWDFDNLIALRAVFVGKEERTQAPTPPDDSGISSGGLAALAVSIVLGACALVAFLFWDKKEKWGFRRQSQASQPTPPIPEGVLESRDCTAVSNEGGVRDPQAWGSAGRDGPEGWGSTQLRTPPRYDSSTLPTTTMRGSIGGSVSDRTSLTTGSHHGRLQSRSNGAPISMRTGVFGRVRDVSEISVTDSDGGIASDTGSDGGYVIDPPTLPSIADVSEPFITRGNVGALSPMHIPDEEDEAHHEYTSSQEMLGLGRSQPNFGFSMTIQELE